MIAKTRAAPTALLALALAACAPSADTDAAPETAETPAPAAVETPAIAAARSYADWVGTWSGPEGLFVTITDAGEGRYMLEMQADLDTTATYEGTATPEGIAFTRGGEPTLLKKATGDETGLKWLAGKQDCLMVDEGEGFCRD
jgi:hypothetical protein